ncbi:MAG: CRISPR-associated helicase Cas3' [Anaerolineales bacterium]|nr:CRISPR-associated helicase Cas3' [Anaerolineales bacterium]
MGETQAREFYAHTKEGEGKEKWQKLIDHLTATSKLAEVFGQDAGIAPLAKTAALLHDLGKYSLEFQQRLEGKPLRVDHSTAGAKEICQFFQGTAQAPLAALLAYCIIGHHTGLPDFGDPSDLPGDGTLTARLKTEVCDYTHFKAELDPAQVTLPGQLAIRPDRRHPGFSFAFMTRMIYSTLVDADFQDTERFMQGEKPRGGHERIEALRDRLDVHLRRFDNPTSGINQKRTETLRHCIEKAAQKPGFFKLTVPTGGGKTLASMAFALHHAAEHDLKRIIYVIPFTTIIEQNAGVFKEIVGEENVLEHHSNFDWEQKKREATGAADDQTRSVYTKLKLAAENWEIPVVVTTNVQFFESLFASRSSRCRKLHNLAKSVIIFDEAQMFPKDYMLPAMSAIWELVTNYGASSVFCTATQPNLERFLPEGTEITELAPNPQELFDFYKRVEVRHLKDKLTDAALIARLREHEQVLCIVNTRKHASGLFQKLESQDAFHLSTLMCPAHRRQKLAEIRERLETGQLCRVVSTSVMEAGIDVDFPVGYRALTGLDSINQAAGRVNRNMKRSMGEMFIFEPDTDLVRRTPRYVAQGVEVTRSVLRKYDRSPISIPAIHAYFEQLYALKDPHDFDFQKVLDKFYIDRKSQPIFKFATVAENFRVIEDITKTLIIPFGKEAKRLVEELKITQYPLYTLRKLQPYTVSIYEWEFDALSSKGVVEMAADAYAVLSNMEDYYDPNRGLLVPAGGGGDGLFF